ncbi:response regulator [Methylobacterium durans]|uniref:response regulator n=1 Tax=Methylobacterium durans TaxID=2202825 RepID=UPI002AFF4AC4|nr:response regulator [Methylobacterium durans]MEA1834796.1 response regulator [Methylobacterium durans]
MAEPLHKRSPSTRTDRSTKPLAGTRVLLVEDQYFLADDLRRHFEENGAKVLGPVPGVREALELIADTPEIDAAVLDVNLRGEMVYPVADVLRARGVPFIFATGYRKTAIPARYASVHHCEKPLDPAQIVKAIFV